jgi:hypothetical protein
VSISLIGQTPDIIRVAQLTRLAGTVPVLLGLLIAVVVTISLRRVDGQRQAWATAFALLAIVIAIDRTRPLPGTEAVVASSDPRVQMLGTLDGQSHGRVLADPVVTAKASLALNGARFVGSYSGRDWSIVGGPSQFYMGDMGTPPMRTAYLAATGTEYVIVRSGVRPEIVDPATGSTATWRFVDTAGGFDLLQTPWPPALAWHMPLEDRDGLIVPDADFRDVGSAYVRDVVVERLAEMTTRDQSAGAVVQYPDGESIVVTATGLDGYRYLVVNENWGKSWAATINGNPLPIERFGANQIGTDLSGITGDATVVLRHSWPLAQEVGLYVSLLSLPVALVLGVLLHRAQTRRRRR